MELLTELNALYTYLERCQTGARIFTEVMSELTKEEQLENKSWSPMLLLKHGKSKRSTC